MRRRSPWALVALLAAPVAALVTWRRMVARRRERVDVYFADGSMISFAEGTPEGDQLLGPGRRALAASRSAA